jgi:hypothetical protein
MPTRTGGSSANQSLKSDIGADYKAGYGVTRGNSRQVYKVNDLPDAEREAVYKARPSARFAVGSGIAGAGTNAGAFSGNYKKGGNLEVSKADIKVMIPSSKALMEMIKNGDTKSFTGVTYIDVPLGNYILPVALNTTQDEKGKTVYQANGQWVGDAFSRAGLFGTQGPTYDSSYLIADEINRMLGSKLRKD